MIGLTSLETWANSTFENCEDALATLKTGVSALLCVDGRTAFKAQLAFNEQLSAIKESYPHIKIRSLSTAFGDSRGEVVICAALENH